MRDAFRHVLRNFEFCQGIIEDFYLCLGAKLFYKFIHCFFALVPEQPVFNHALDAVEASLQLGAFVGQLDNVESVCRLNRLRCEGSDPLNFPRRCGHLFLVPASNEYRVAMSLKYRVSG